MQHISFTASFACESKFDCMFAYSNCEFIIFLLFIYDGKRSERWVCFFVLKKRTFQTHQILLVIFGKRNILLAKINNILHFARMIIDWLFIKPCTGIRGADFTSEFCMPYYYVRPLFANKIIINIMILFWDITAAIYGCDNFIA